MRDSKTESFVDLGKVQSDWTTLFPLVCCSANPEHKLSDNTLDLSIPLVHETDTTITG